MAKTIGKPGERDHLRRPARSREVDRCGKIRPRSIARDLDGADWEPETAYPAAAFASGAKAIAPVLLALTPFGMAFGATAMGSGLSTIEALAMSVIVLAGAAQLAAVQLIAADTSVAVVVLTVLVINLRLTLYSASLAPHFRPLPIGWKGFLSYHLTDQAYIATLWTLQAIEQGL